ncbi:MAG TPA: methionine--tRNA ligase, partial [Planctomycetota bacterium]|nr:methionine--tRNA ligase [Planctomycetota bacterium]
LKGEEVLYVCGTDEHGVAITIGAEKEHVPYADYVAHWRASIKSTFDRLGLAFDVWSGTSISPPHAALSQEFFRRLGEGGYLQEKVSEQLYCVQDSMFLADRYVAGTCPFCGFRPARGDECPRCGKWLDPLNLIEPECKVCGTRPERRKTRHWYLDLPKLRDEHIGAWFEGHDWKPNVKTFIGNQLKEVELRPITRDMSWGVKVPPDLAHGETGKVLYVWFDAPIGYVSFTAEWAAARGEPEAWKDWWQNPDTRLVHFIGKDNIPFHCLVFPSMLFGVKQNYVLPWQVPANEFYNLQGRKFSTSAGWSIDLDDFFARFDAESARFYLLSSAPETADSEWNWNDYQRVVNTQLADTIGNLATRVLKFIEKNFEGRIPACDPAHREELDRVLFEECGAFGDPADAILAFRFRRASEQLIENARVANVFIDRMAPWSLRKTDPVRCASVLNTCCEWIGWVSRWSAPFMPGKAQKLWAMLGNAGEVASIGWCGVPERNSWRSLEPGQKLGLVEGLFAKVDDKLVQAEIEAIEKRARGEQPADTK